MIFITRKESFCAAHKLFRNDWSDKENLEVFGKCSNPNWHGHNYDLYVTIKGEQNPATSFLINLQELSEIINRHVIDKIDHKNINLDVEFMSGKIASTESLVVGIWKQLEEPVRKRGCLLHKIKIQETDKNSVEYYGETDNNK